MHTYYKTIFSFCLIAVAISAFAQTQKKRTGKVNKVHPLHISPSRYDDAVDSNWLPGMVYVPDIAPDKMGAAGTQLKGIFQEETAFRKLFPGRYFYVADDDGKNPYGIVLWRSRHFPSVKLKDESEGVSYMFPGRGEWLTKISEVKIYKDDSGRQHALMVFETNELNPLDVMYGGTFTGAKMSLALFTKAGDNWVLKSFTLAAGVYGAYKRLPKVDAIKLGVNNYGCYVHQQYYNPGGPGYGTIYLYGIVGGQFKQILTGDNASRYMRSPCCEWATEIRRQSTSLLFDDLQLVTKGDFCRSAFEKGAGYDSVIDVPKEVDKRTANTDSFGFRIVKTYHFEQNRYKLKTTAKKYFDVKKRIAR